MRDDMKIINNSKISIDRYNTIVAVLKFKNSLCAPKLNSNLLKIPLNFSYPEISQFQNIQFSSIRKKSKKMYMYLYISIYIYLCISVV